ncbi:HlyD family efflux transporter periplasmic adaptor subunit [Alteromonas sp. 1_MG-2023]|uniref:HlyD family secretion protein n=1 Tax=Alteromonas sp. 1_MG-2023 TaxID=3062669 RepID=UPI0026E2244C|nr:HlyD family efflux transporter periplasmic adaptor subunit [Alteromonas sp. 1_MG-2023]MDO6567971.1 HlyD family efflux transporter periplasmic adaptor subunit [Alteromonas sp. 1_MG-2023]
MRKGLFRHQAMQPASPLQGELLMTPRLSHMVITAVLILWIVGLGIYLTNGSYARKATVEGWLEPSQGVLRLYADSRKGRISKVFVSEGQNVEKGEPLLAIEYGVQHSTGETVELKLQQELTLKKQRVVDTLARTERIQNQNKTQLLRQRIHAQADADSLRHILDISHKQWQLALNQFNSLNVLHSAGHVSKADYDTYELELLIAQQQWKQAERNHVQSEAEISRLTHDINSLPELHANERTTLENQLTDINQQLLTLARDSQRILYASTKGTVSSLQVRAGLMVDQNKPLLNLIPANSSIEARLLVPVHAAGFISYGQQLDIRYDAFPYQKFGLQAGQIVSVSDTILLPGEWANSPLSVDEPAYLVTAKVSNDAIMAYGNPIALKAGMTFSADVALSQRSLLEWLLEPLLSITKRL